VALTTYHIWRTWVRSGRSTFTDVNRALQTVTIFATCDQELFRVIADKYCKDRVGASEELYLHFASQYHQPQLPSKDQEYDPYMHETSLQWHINSQQELVNLQVWRLAGNQEGSDHLEMVYSKFPLADFQ
jgi:hypothetical protein